MVVSSLLLRQHERPTNTHKHSFYCPCCQIREEQATAFIPQQHHKRLLLFKVRRCGVPTGPFGSVSAFSSSPRRRLLLILHETSPLQTKTRLK